MKKEKTGQGDKLGRTCRQLGNLKGRELADNHPLKLLCERRLNTINRCIRRGTIDADLAKAMKMLAKDKLLRALSESRYDKGGYEKQRNKRSFVFTLLNASAIVSHKKVKRLMEQSSHFLTVS